jgi:hypothetical protein
MPEVGTPEPHGLECRRLGEAIVCGELLDEPGSGRIPLKGDSMKHTHSPDWVMEESKRLFPLDLSARVEWIREQAETHIDEAERRKILRRLEQLKNGVAR